MPERIVERKPRPRDRVFIRLSGGRFFAIPEEAAAALVVGAELSDDDVDRLDRLGQWIRGRDRAVRLLALRARSKREVEDTLRTMGISDAVRGGIVADLEESGLIDDARLAREFVSIKKDVRHAGPHRLRADMKKRGLRREVVEQALSDYGAGEQEAIARALVEKRTGGGPVDERLVRRVTGMLTRKGFDYAVINRIAADLVRRIDRGDPDADVEVMDDE